MKVGIIGHEGFVGSALSEAFAQDRECIVAGIGRRDYDAHICEHFDILINANGNSSKRLADAKPEDDFGMNAASTLRMLLDFQCDHYVHISTVEVYNDKSRQETTREDARIEPSALTNYGFSKYVGEMVARKYAKKCLVLRLAGMVGKNMKKGPAYDIMNGGKIFISRKSRLHFIDTSEVAAIAKRLVDLGKWGETYNVVGKGAVSLEEFAKIAGVELTGDGAELVEFGVSTEKIERIAAIPTSLETVAMFAGRARE